jgi:hypothetical protein
MTTQLVDDRDAALRVGYVATDWSADVSFDTYREVMKDWIIKAIVRDGECIGAFFKKDCEVHVSVLPKWRKMWATPGLLRKIFEGPRVTTKVSTGHEYMYGILGRLGFKDNGEMLVKE